MSRIRLFLILISVGLFTSILWGEANEKTGKDVLRIISLGPALTEELFLLGAGDKIVGVTLYCHKPDKAMKIEKVSTAINVNIEKIVSLRPDLVVATSLISPKNIEMLEKLGIRVVVFRAAESFKDLCNQFAELGRLAGKENEAKNILEEVQKKVDAVRKSVEGFVKPRMIIQIGARPLWIAAKDSFMNDFIEFAGGENLGPQGTNGHISREKILELDPEIIFISTMGILGEEEKKEWQKFTVLSAVKNNRIFIFDSDSFCSPTPVSFASTLKETADVLHPGI